MQSIFRLPWSSDQFGLGAADKIRFGQDIAPIRTDLAGPIKMKRKRASTPDPEPASRPQVKKSRPATAVTFSHAPASLAVQTASQPTAKIEAATDRDSASAAQSLKDKRATKPDESGSMGDTNMVDAHAQSQNEIADQRRSKLCQAIENQINLQILMKHNELRLIDQELAKCQVALEQLRRCELQPYPGSDGFDYSISTGSGSAVRPAQGQTVPTHAPPHGVTDGPYTRHYRQWLLPDPQFDSQPIAFAHAVSAQASAGARGGRVGRKSTAPAAYGLPQRNEIAGPPVIAPPARKDSNMPLVLRRSTDNKLVKLVCNNCNRGNMSSIQGFLNHCRIAHKVIYESHDAAAKDCGRILDDQELASLPAETQSQPVTKPVARPPRAQSLTMAPPSSTSVHPFNAPHAKVKLSKPTAKAKSVSAVVVAQPDQHASAPFKPAMSLPRLSAFFARKQAGGDLEQAAADAQTRSELALEELMSPASMTPGSPAIATPTSARPGVAEMHRFQGGKGQAQSAQRSYFAPAQPEQDLDSPREMNLSPHAVDSNPGLVSDLEDDDNGSASEEESTAPPHSIGHPLGMNRTCGDSVEIAVAEDDGVVHHGGVIIRRNSTFGAEHRGLHVGKSSNKLGGNQAV